jgi:predicted nucleic acid-binding protein
VSLVISGTSPIRDFDHLNLLWVLERLYQTIIVPPAVANELANPGGSFKQIDTAQMSFMKITTPSDASTVAALLKKLDKGEAEAIALAVELHADAILIDEAAVETSLRSLDFRTRGCSAC